MCTLNFSHAEIHMANLAVQNSIDWVTALHSPILILKTSAGIQIIALREITHQRPDGNTSRDRQLFQSVERYCLGAKNYHVLWLTDKFWKSRSASSYLARFTNTWWVIKLHSQLANQVWLTKWSTKKSYLHTGDGTWIQYHEIGKIMFHV